jgi:predicted permease
VRRAIGASRTRLVRLLLTENLLLCLMAGGLALLCAAWGIDLVELFVSQTVGTTVDLRVDLRAFGFAIVISLLTGAAVGLAPALQATRLDIATHMRQAAPSVLGKRSRLSQPLLVAQLALSLVLLVAAGLLGQSVRKMQRFDVGFDTRNLLLFSLDPESVGYDDSRTIALYEQLIERLEAMPGVSSATTSEYPLVSGSGSGNSIHVQGSSLRPNQGRIRRMKIRANFLQAMGVPVVQGRDLTPRDNQSAPQVALINQTLARQFFPNVNPVGRRFGFGSAERSGDIEIVGVVRDAAIDKIRRETPPTVFVSYLQRVHGAGTIIVRTTAAPLQFVPAIQEMVRQVAPDVPAIGFHTQQQQVRTSFITERALANTSTLFSAIALLLACIGLYGMMSYNVARRSSEIAIRMALGARRDGVVWLVLREVVALIAIGVAIGLAAAFAVTRTFAALLYELTPNDPRTIAAAVFLLCLVGVLAGYLPARRAARVDPWTALRYE